MPNPLTGDYEAVAQVSGRTLNRLLASMHQNAGANSKVPSMLHEAVLRVGDAGFHKVIAGVRGTAWIQLGPPAVELIHGARDRFTIEIWIRAHYEPDPGTTTLPSHIYGRVRADYQVAVIEFAEEQQGTQLWVGVDRRSVTFTSATPDTSHDAQITEQVRHALAYRFTATPHKLLDEFKKRRFRSLVAGGESAVVHPLDVTGAGVTGTVSSVNQVFLGGNDFAVAVNHDVILAGCGKVVADE